DARPASEPGCRGGDDHARGIFEAHQGGLRTVGRGHPVNRLYLDRLDLEQLAGMKVVLLGTGGPRPDPKRNASTTLIRLGEENILFDAGRGVVNQLVRVGVPLSAVNPVFITHHHFDHIGDLYDVALATWM